MTNAMILIFNIVNFPFLDGDVLCAPSYSVYISQHIRFARVSSRLADFNTCNKHRLPAFSKRDSDIINFGKLFL